jgi:hypothetical protein
MLQVGATGIEGKEEEEELCYLQEEGYHLAPCLVWYKTYINFKNKFCF